MICLFVWCITQLSTVFQFYHGISLVSYQNKWSIYLVNADPTTLRAEQGRPFKYKDRSNGNLLIFNLQVSEEEVVEVLRRCLENNNSSVITKEYSITALMKLSTRFTTTRE